MPENHSVFCDIDNSTMTLCYEFSARALPSFFIYLRDLDGP